MSLQAWHHVQRPAVRSVAVTSARRLGVAFGWMSLMTLLAIPSLPAQDEAAQLERVRERIHSLGAEIARATQKRDRASAGLHRVELDIARANRKLTTLRAELEQTRLRSRQLSREEDEHRQSLAAEQSALAGQLRGSYVNGKQERLKLLLNHRDPRTLGRMLVYYDYLNRVRFANIQSVNHDLEKIAALQREARELTLHLEDLEQQRNRELASLEDARVERRALVDELNAGIAHRGEEVEQLARQESELKAVIEELGRRMAEFPVNTEAPFDSLKGQLTWPVKGRLLRDYGQPRAEGRLTWHGVLIGAEAGSEVRAVYHGRVVFADWLPGLGLLSVIDHGGGYLSLYGHNQTLLREAGDWVSPGDVVASVGNSGGQGATALYFELRQGTEPLDPHRWISRKLARR